MINSPIEEIKNRLDIVEVVGSYLKLTKTGANYRALCPFHSEKKPSFFVSPSRQLWRCFGCGLGGDIFAFIKQIEGVEFGDALRLLANRAGVELKQQDPQLKTERKRLYEICELATCFFERQLEASRVGQEVKKYLLDRKINEESIKRWRLGYAPNSWRGLSDFLVAKGYRREEVERAGLAIKSPKAGTYYDRFRGRIIFPVFDLNSQAVGFGGRIFEPTRKQDQGEAIPEEIAVAKEIEEQNIAKYINSPATLLYDKSRILYGLDKAKVAIRKKEVCLLVEGYTDVIMVFQAGYENVVATSGTALTPYHLRILKRYTENLMAAFDMDTAGNSATKRGTDLAQAAGFNIKVVVMPEEMDPADIVSRDPKEWERLVEAAKSILEFYFETTFSRFDPMTIEGKKQIAKILLPVIKMIPNKIEQTYWLEELTKRLKVREEDLELEMKKTKVETITETKEEVVPPIVQKSRKQLLEERLLALVMHAPENLSLLDDKEVSCFSSPCYQIFTHFKEAQAVKANSINFPPELNDLANYLFLLAEAEDFNSLDVKEELQASLKEFKILLAKNRLDELSKQLKTAEAEDNKEKIEALFREFNLCSQSLSNLEKD